MKFYPLYFFIALFIGFFLIYVVTPPPKLVLKNPNPQNAKDITYIDDNNVCYRYKKKQIDCPLDPKINIINY